MVLRFVLWVVYIEDVGVYTGHAEKSTEHGWRPTLAISGNAVLIYHHVDHISSGCIIDNDDFRLLFIISIFFCLVVVVRATNVKHIFLLFVLVFGMHEPNVRLYPNPNMMSTGGLFFVTKSLREPHVCSL